MSSVLSIRSIFGRVGNRYRKEERMKKLSIVALVLLAALAFVSTTTAEISPTVESQKTTVPADAGSSEYEALLLMGLEVPDWMSPSTLRTNWYNCSQHNKPGCTYSWDGHCCCRPSNASCGLICI